MTFIIANQQMFYRNLTSIDEFNSSKVYNAEERNYYLEIIHKNKQKPSVIAPYSSTNQTEQINNNNNVNQLNANNNKTPSVSSINININHINQENPNSENNQSAHKNSLSPFSRGNSHRSGNILQLPSQKTERSSGNDKGNSFLNVSGLLSQFSEKTNLSFMSNDRIKKLPASEKEMPEDVQTKIKEIFSKLFLFFIFPDSVLMDILSNLIIIEIEKDDYLYQKGSEARCFYIMTEGVLEEYDKDDKLIQTYREWDYFGYMSLMNKNYFAKNEGSIKCIESAKLYVLSGETFLIIRQKLIKLRLQERFEMLNHIIFFRHLDCIAKHLLAEQLEFVEVEENKQILGKNINDLSIYLINTGSVVCMDGDKEIKTLGINTYVGLMTILFNTNTIDVFTREKSTFFKLKHKDLKDILGENYIHDMLFTLFKEYIQSNSKFVDLINESNNITIFSKFKLKIYDKYEKINEKNQNLQRIMLIIQGNFVDEITTKILYPTGSVIGDDVLSKGMQIPTNLCAFPDCVTLEAELNDISDLFGEEIKINTVNFLQKVITLQKTPFFRALSDLNLKNIINHVKVEKFYSTQKIVEEGMEPLHFYIIIKGTVKVSKASKQIRILEKDSSFGEYALLHKTMITATVTAVTNTTCYVIDKEPFELIAHCEDVKEYFKRTTALQNDDLTLSSFNLIKHLGRGKFGMVSLIHNNNYIYAIKAISRVEADRKKRFASYLIWERRIMLSLDHPFIVKMVRGFKNDYFVFLLIEYVNGICLKELINQQIKLFTVGDTRFYVANILLAIEYMHKKKIVHRDIKPNNIMVNSNGYLKLIDFGTAKLINNYTNTIIGTPHYMAPEILLGKGYSFSVDFWSLGVCAFELFYHRYPFGYQATEVMQVYNDIMYNNYKYPVENKYFSKLNELIEKLLSKQVNKRFCSCEKIQTLELYAGFKWDELYEMKMPPPYVPEFIDYNQINFSYYTNNYEEIINKEGENKLKNVKKDVPVDVEWANEF